MTAIGFFYGHLVHWTGNEWVYSDTGTASERRLCPECDLPPTREGYDACIGYIPGVRSACCGHGVESSYIVYEGIE